MVSLQSETMVQRQTGEFDARQSDATSAKIHPDSIDSGHSDNSSELPVQQKGQQALAELMIQAKNLKSNHQLVTQQIDEAQERLEQNELQRGQMIQQYLQLGRNIEQKEREVAADEDRLRSLRISQGKVTEEIGELLAQIQLIG